MNLRGPGTTCQSQREHDGAAYLEILATHKPSLAGQECFPTITRRLPRVYSGWSSPFLVFARICPCGRPPSLTVLELLRCCS